MEHLRRGQKGSDSRGMLKRLMRHSLRPYTCQACRVELKAALQLIFAQSFHFAVSRRQRMISWQLTPETSFSCQTLQAVLQACLILIFSILEKRPKNCLMRRTILL